MPKEALRGLPTLQGCDLRRTFGVGESRTQALADVSVGLYPGEVHLLMGPSGSGKTTLLAVLSGLLHPTSGQVLAHDQDLWKMSERQRERFRLRYCGFIFQESNLFAALTARQQLEIVLRWGEGVSAREARARTDAMLARLGLSKKGHLRRQELSGGEKQRVAVGRALVKNSTFCFADEPTSALDWMNAEHVLELLRDAAHERGTMVLLVGHDARLIAYADRVFFMEDGVLRDGPPPPSTLAGWPKDESKWLPAAGLAGSRRTFT